MYNLNVCIVDRERSEAKVRKEKTKKDDGDNGQPHPRGEQQHTHRQA